MPVQTTIEAAVVCDGNGSIVVSPTALDVEQGRPSRPTQAGR